MIVIRTPTWGKHQRPRRIDTSDEPTPRGYSVGLRTYCICPMRHHGVKL